MGIVFRQSVKNTLVIFLGAVLGTIIIWLSTKYIVEKQLFGYTKTITIQAVTLSQILLMGLNNTLSVYIHRYADNLNKRRLLITLCFSLPLIIIGVFTIFYILCKTWILRHFQPDDIPLMQEFYLWFPFYTLLFVYMVIFEQYLGSQMKIAVSAFMREVVVRVLSIILLLFYAFNYINFHNFVVGTILIYVVPVFIFYILSLKTDSFRLTINLSYIPNNEYREIIHFSWYHFLFTGSVLLLGTMDALLIPLYDHKGVSSIAIYSVAIFLISFLQMPYKAMLMGSYTVMAKAFSDNDKPKATNFFVRSSINMFIPTVIMAVLISCNLNNAVAIIKNGYAEIIPIFLILLIGKLFDIATGMNDQVLSITNYYKFNFYLSLILIFVLFLLIRILVPVYGIYGAAWSTTITIIIFNSIKYLFVYKKLNMQPFSKNTFITLFAGGVTSVIGYYLPFLLNPVIDALIRSIVIMVVFLLLMLWLKPSEDLVEYLESIKRNKRLY